jgi:hypothetical protein
MMFDERGETTLTNKSEMKLTEETKLAGRDDFVRSFIWMDGIVGTEETIMKIHSEDR